MIRTAVSRRLRRALSATERMVVLLTLAMLLGASPLHIQPAQAGNAAAEQSTAANATEAAGFRAAVARNATVDAPHTHDAAPAMQAPSREQAGTDAPRLTTPDASHLPSSGWGNYFQAIGILLFILGALYMGLWALKRFGKLRGAGGALGRQGLSVEGQFHIGPKKSLVVVRFLNKRLLLGVTDQQINLLTEMEADNDSTHSAGTAQSSDFAELLEDAGNKDSTA